MGKNSYKVSGGTDRERGQEVVRYIVASSFGTKNNFETTLILLNRATNNGFYEKHVLRLDDDSEDTLDLRQNIDNVSVSRLGEAIDRFGVVAGNKVTIKNAPASTMLRLDKIDLKLAVFTIAEAFVDAMLEDHFGDYLKTDTSGNYDIQITFPAECVEQRDRSGGVEMGKTMTIGGSRTSRAAGDPAKVAFDVNHCNGT
jgi:hypothetical protein